MPVNLFTGEMTASGRLVCYTVYVYPELKEILASDQAK